SGSPFEPRIGFSRAVRVGPFVAVSGTAPIAPGGGMAAPGDMYGQTRRCLEIIEQAVRDAGPPPGDGSPPRVLPTDLSAWEEAARAHGEFFGKVKPASTFVEVKGLVDRGWLVEIEADCIDEKALRA